jgi:hypothetical protein
VRALPAGGGRAGARSRAGACARKQEVGPGDMAARRERSRAGRAARLRGGRGAGRNDSGGGRVGIDAGTGDGRIEHRPLADGSRAGAGSWDGPTRARRGRGAAGRGRRELTGGEEKVAAAAGRGGRRPGRAAATAARRGETYGSDTMLGIDKLYSLGAKGHNI